jgi:diacylglycerol kinase
LKSKNVRESFSHAIRGLRHASGNERNFKIHLAMGCIAIIACIALRLETPLFIWIVFAVFTVLITELINTAIETLTDLSSGGKYHPLAKTAKDAAAAAVFLASAQALTAGAVATISIISRWANN